MANNYYQKHKKSFKKKHVKDIKISLKKKKDFSSLDNCLQTNPT